MRKSYLGFLAVLTLGVLWIQACGSKSGPTSPSSGSNNSGPTATITSTPTVNSTPGTGIIWNGAIIEPGAASVILKVNGQPLTTVNVVMTGTSITTPVTMVYSSTSSSGAAYQTSSFTYTAGQSYTLTTTSGALSAAGTLTAPGNVTVASNGSQISWTVAGTQGYIEVYNSLSTQTFYDFSTGLASPFSVPATAYNGGGSFTVEYGIENELTAVPGASTGSVFIVEDTGSSIITIATPTITETPTITDSPTITSTPTITLSPTASFTPTSTPSVTNTATFTFTPTITQTPTSTSTSINTFTFTPTTTFTVMAASTSTPTVTSTSTTTKTPTVTATVTTTSTATPYSQSVSFGLTSGGEPYAIRYSTVTGDLWITDENNEKLQEWTTAGSSVTSLGADFESPMYARGLGIDPNSGNVYASDILGGKFVVFSSTGTYLTNFEESGDDKPYGGIVINSAGTTLFGVDETNTSVILTFSIGGTASSPTFTYVREGNDGASSDDIAGLTIDPGGELWNAETTTRSVYEYTTDLTAQITSILLPGSGTPSDVAVDSSENVFVTDTTNDQVLEFNSSNKLTNTFGKATTPPTGLTLDGNGNLYVSYSGNYVLGFKVN